MANSLATGGNTTATLSEAILDQYADIILYEALPAMRFEQFAVERTDLMKNPSDTLQFMKFDDISGDPALASESTEVSVANLSSSTVAITVDEYAQAVAVSEKLLIVSFTDVMREQAKILGRHYSQFGPEKLCRDVALDNGGTDVSVLFAGGKATRADLVGDDVFTTDLIRDAVETLQTSNAPKFEGDYYVCIAHPHQLRYLRQDPDWVAANNAHMSGNPMSGLVGRWEDVIFLSSTNLPNGTGAVGTLQFLDDGAGDNALAAGIGGNQTNVYQASIFGEAAFALAHALPVEMRDDGVEDFGRVHKLAWYAIYGAGLLHPNYVLRLETA